MKTLFKTILFIIFSILISPNKVFADNKIRIGLVVPLSGEYAFVGESIIKSVRLALNQINDERIEIVPEDSGANPIDTLRTSKKLYTQGIKIIIGPVFNESSRYLDELKEVTFISLTNKIYGNPPNVISAGVNAISQLNTIDKFRKINEIERSIILIPRTDYRKEIDEALTKTELKLKDKFFYDTDPTLLTAQIEKITRYPQRKQNLLDEIKRIEDSNLNNKEKKMINLKDNIKKFFKRKLEIEETLSTSNLDPKEYATLSKELSDVIQVTDLSSLINSKKNELEDLYILLKDKESDADLQDMAREESKMLENEINSLNKKLELAILPKDKDDQRNVILEVRAGTGGDEAGIFAANLFNMYQKFSMNNNWKFEILSVSDTGVGGYKEAHANIVGGGAFGKLKFESGVHRVQRVPVTETNGRVHTSAATVAVLPEAEDVEINLNDKDLRIDVYRSSGPGGQSVNTTDSAVRITHIPSGIVVSQQDEKSQHKNKAKAMKILLARLYDQERQIQNSKIASTRKNQVGTGDRSERIRTYNYPQGRVTDHRINLTLHKIEKIIEGEGLDEIIDNLILKDRVEKLEENG